MSIIFIKQIVISVFIFFHNYFTQFRYYNIYCLIVIMENLNVVSFTGQNKNAMEN